MRNLYDIVQSYSYSVSTQLVSTNNKAGRRRGARTWAGLRGAAVLTTSVVGKGIDLHARRGIITRFNVQTSHERSAFAQLSTVAHQMG